jgi:pyridoxal/pyridoxine/pyridoxamine kinase
VLIIYYITNFIIINFVKIILRLVRDAIFLSSQKKYIAWCCPIFGFPGTLYIEAEKKEKQEKKMKKLVSIIIALAISLSALAAPVISIQNNPSVEMTDQEIKDAVAASIGVLSLESIEDKDYIFIAVTEEGWIIVEIDGDYYIVIPDSE